MLELTVFGFMPDSIFSKTTNCPLNTKRKLNVYEVYILVSYASVLFFGLHENLDYVLKNH